MIVALLTGIAAAQKCVPISEAHLYSPYKAGSGPAYSADKAAPVTSKPVTAPAYNPAKDAAKPVTAPAYNPAQAAAKPAVPGGSISKAGRTTYVQQAAKPAAKPSPAPAVYRNTENLKATIALLDKLTPKVPQQRTNNFENDCLVMHNRYRQLVNKAPLSYSLKLQGTAQEWADNLASRDAFEHNQKWDYGENLFQTSNGDTSCARAMEVFFEEYRLYDNEPIGKNYKKFEAYGHFTQMIWPSTKLVGCARAAYRKGYDSKQTIVCHYDPPGNTLNTVLQYDCKP
jgi:uncharacterized protein YkwD